MLVIEIVKQNGRDQGCRAKHIGPQSNGKTGTQYEHHHANTPRREDADLPARNRPLLPMLAVEFHIRRVIEDHAAGVEQ
jgi:hypothetical protein